MNHTQLYLFGGLVLLFLWDISNVLTDIRSQLRRIK